MTIRAILLYLRFVWRQSEFAFFGVCSFGCTHFFIFRGGVMVALWIIAGALLLVLFYFACYGIKDRIDEYKTNHPKDDDWRQYKTTEPELASQFEDAFRLDWESAKRGKRYTTYSCKNKNSYYCLYCPRRREVVRGGIHYFGSGVNCKYYKENTK